MGAETFAADLGRWLEIPDGPAPLSTGGRHILKTLIWCAALAKADNLDNVLSAMIDVEYADQKAAFHLIYAVGYWLESRPPEVSEPLRRHLRNKWPIPGSRIRD
jgi:hypothetical protein